MTSFANRLLAASVATAMLLSSQIDVVAQEVVVRETVEDVGEVMVIVAPLDEEGRLVRFDRDVAPILRARCLECHGPDEAKNDFRVDDVDSLMQYVEPEDLESSTMYIDYMVTDDEDMLMPPKSHNGPLSPAELALIRIWIEEGADWPEGFELVAESVDAGDSPPVESPPTPKTLGERVWAFQGYLHPATVHFPIAFFLLGALFVVLGWKWPSVGTQIPLACLLLGALSSIASTAMGWSFAPEQGYGSSWNPFDWDREIDVHRWSAVIVTVLSVVLSVIALTALWKGSDRLTSSWKVGLLVLAGMVGLVGHQGGEMSYGADFYPKAFRILLGSSDQVASVDDASSQATAADAGDQPDQASRGDDSDDAGDTDSSD